MLQIIHKTKSASHILAEDDFVVSMLTSKGTGGIVESVAVSSRTTFLEESGVVCWSTGLSRSVGASAAVFVLTEGCAGTQAFYGMAITVTTEFVWTLSDDIGIASSNSSAISFTIAGFDLDLDVVAIHKTYIVEIQAVPLSKTEFSQSNSNFSPFSEILLFRNISCWLKTILIQFFGIFQRYANMIFHGFRSFILKLLLQYLPVTLFRVSTAPSFAVKVSVTSCSGPYSTSGPVIRNTNINGLPGV